MADGLVAVMVMQWVDPLDLSVERRVECSAAEWVHLWVDSWVAQWVDPSDWWVVLMVDH